MVLDKIVDQKKIEIETEKAQLPLFDLKKQLKSVNFSQKPFISKIRSDIKKNNIAIISVRYFFDP